MMTQSYANKYDTPSELVRDQSLNATDKIRMLDNWKQDVQRMLDSTSENMPAQVEGMNSEEAALLQEIDQALLYLNRESPASDPNL